MNEVNTIKLITDFPYLYRGFSNPNNSIQKGFNIGDGWFSLIYQLSEKIENEATKANLNKASELWPEAVQVKEKFGTLRIYVHCRSGLTSFSTGKLIEEAESISATICENCGNKGELRYEAWIKTLCDTCTCTYNKT